MSGNTFDWVPTRDGNENTLLFYFANGTKTAKNEDLVRKKQS